VKAPKIPKLATGAVIPKNAEFAAILGDNKKENEILAPESTIRRIVAEEIANMQNSQTVTINFAGSLSAFIRELRPYIEKENSRAGVSLIKNGSTS
jgi:ABC-type molybdate transport system substrate-binding protein